VIGLSQRPPPNNTLQSQETDVHDPAGFEPAIPASELPQNYALDGAAAGIGYPDFTHIFYCCDWFSVSDACKICYCIMYFKCMYVRPVNMNVIGMLVNVRVSSV